MTADQATASLVRPNPNLPGRLKLTYSGSLKARLCVRPNPNLPGRLKLTTKSGFSLNTVDVRPNPNLPGRLKRFEIDKGYVYTDVFGQTQICLAD